MLEQKWVRIKKNITEKKTFSRNFIVYSIENLYSIIAYLSMNIFMYKHTFSMYIIQLIINTINNT